MGEGFPEVGDSIFTQFESMFTSEGKQDRGGAEAAQRGNLPHQGPIPEGGIHAEEILAFPQGEPGGEGGAQQIESGGGSAEGGSILEAKNKGLRRRFDTQKQHLFTVRDSLHNTVAGGIRCMFSAIHI